MYKVAATINKEHYKTIVTTGKNLLISDEPETTGGKERGLSPGELLAASLASCTTITLRMYADRKGWLLERVEVDVTIDRDELRNITKISRKIKMIGTLDDKQKKRLLVIADKCPIHKFLTNHIVINTMEE
jgi:putative redox protein